MIVILTIIQEILFSVSYAPEFARLYKVKDSKSISLWYCFSRLFGLFFLEAIYILTEVWPLAIGNLLSILLEAGLIYLVILYRRK